MTAELDPDNPVVRLCADGMMAEGAGDPQGAAECFRQAWEARSDDFEACIAAHYVARHQDTPAATHAWNERALEHAEAAVASGDLARVEGFLASLHLNLGRSHEDLGDVARARAQYARAEQAAAALEDDGYAALVRRGAAAGLRRVGPPAGG